MRATSREARARGLTPAFVDRLTLDDKRIEAMARAVEDIAALPDPVGRVLATFERPNGLKIERVATPLGVVGVIYESRPNVTADAGALVPEERQRRRAARRLRQFPLLRRDPRLPRRGPAPRRACRKRRSRARRSPRARRSARCWRASTARST